jgi:hypothetical protein
MLIVLPIDTAHAVRKGTLDATNALNCGAVTLGSVFDLPLSFLS